MTKGKKVYQFKIQLQDITPPIWRRIQIPETSSFWDLHVAITDAMGWLDLHLHEFTIVDSKTGESTWIGSPDPDTQVERNFHNERETRISDWFNLKRRLGLYTYDFGDGWEHQLELEDILPQDEKIEYPVCLDGARACPPEDCGGIPGYENLLEVLEDPKHPEYEELTTWLGEPFDPEHFDIGEITFEDPEERWDHSLM